MIFTSKPVVTAAAIALSTGLLWANTQPYSGQHTREIASLSAADITALEAGQGWGFAKSAELNGYPGPAHILELSEELSLTDAQVTQIQEIFERMNAEARTLGQDYIAAEAALDAAFADRTVTDETLAQLTQAAGAARSALRSVHLAAHLDAAPLLTRHQTMLYNRARGYDSDGGAHSGHSGHDHN